MKNKYNIKIINLFIIHIYIIEYIYIIYTAHATCYQLF